MTYRASGRKSAPARRPVGHFTSKECARNLGINAISLQPHFCEAMWMSFYFSPAFDTITDIDSIRSDRDGFY